MKSRGVVKGALVGLSCLGMLAPPNVMANEPATSPVAVKAQIADVALAGGTLNGVVVDGQGNAIAGSVVKLSQSQDKTIQVVTNKEGEFAINNLTTGVYHISSGSSSSSVRVWDEQVAPPSAKTNVMLVDGEVERAQFGRYMNPHRRTLIIVGGGLLIAGTTIAIVQATGGSSTPPATQ